MERKTQVREVASSLRRELENYVIAWNKYLVDVVRDMDIIILLRNAHPSYRNEFASQLYKQGIITKDEAKEFVKLV